MTDLNEIQAFVAVAQAGSFIGASRSLGIPKSTISRKVAALEDRLGVLLMQRTTRKAHLTEAGDEYFRSCTRLLSELREAEESAVRSQSKPRGTLRVTAPVEMGTAILGGIVHRYLAEHPDVGIEMILTDRIVDLVGEGVDIAIRAGHLPESGLIAKKLGHDEFQLFASPAYLRKQGHPRHPKELSGHSCLSFTTDQQGEGWELVSGKSRSRVKLASRVAADSLDMLKVLASMGDGIALLPAFLCREDLKSGRLVRVLPDWSSERSSVYVVHPARRFVPPKTRAFVELLTQELCKAYF